MSYILDSLKKLEKEKSEFDNKFDLKKLILKDSSETNAIKILKRRSRLLTFLILAISVFFFLNFYVFKFSPLSLNLPTNLSMLPPISNQVKAPQDLSIAPKNDDSALSVINPPVAPVTGPDKKTELLSKEIETKKEVKENTETFLISQDLSDEGLNQRLDHIEQLIQKEYIPAEVKKLIEEDRRLKPEPTKAIRSKALPQDIADLKISGIVFFGEGATLNYAITSYKGKSQIKLKEGDRLDDIEVLEIQSEKILLVFENEVFEKRLGD